MHNSFLPIWDQYRKNNIVIIGDCYNKLLQSVYNEFYMVDGYSHSSCTINSWEYIFKMKIVTTSS